MLKKINAKIWLGVLLGLVANLGLAANWQFTKEQNYTARQMMEYLSEYYYDKSILKKSNFVDKVFIAYFDTLDLNKEFFMASEIEKFSSQKKVMQKAIYYGNMQLPAKIFEQAYAKKMQRFSKNIQLLQNANKNFSFDSTEKFELDRSKAKWFSSTSQLDNYWHNRLTHELLIVMEAEDKSLTEASEQLKKRYERRIKYLQQTKSIDIFSDFLNAITASLDPHTDYLSPIAEENFNMHMRLSLTGIGATLTNDQDYTKVHSLVPGGPADKQGELQPEDKIIAVAQDKQDFVDVVAMRLDDVVQLIRGKKNTKVRLKILRNKEIKEIEIIRNVVKLEDQAASKRILQTKYKNKDYKLGIIKIPAFYMDFDAANRGEQNYRSTTRDVANLVKQLKAEKVDGILIDLRYNGGGSLQEVSDMVGLFIERGPSVQVRGSNGRISVMGSNRNRQIYDGALAVMINRFSASASEIFAAAMQDYGRALIIGDTSFGKGSVQTLENLRLGQLKLTNAKFYRVSGGSTQNKGVEPDIELPSIIDKNLIGESALSNAMPWDYIRSVIKDGNEISNSKLNTLKNLIAPIKSQEDYAYLNTNANFVINNSKTEFSLNKKAREQENIEFKAKRLNMINVWRVSKDKKPYKNFAAWEEDTKRINKLVNQGNKLEIPFEYLDVVDQAELNVATKIMAIYTNILDDK